MKWVHLLRTGGGYGRILGNPIWERKGRFVAEHGVSIRSFHTYQGLEDGISPSTGQKRFVISDLIDMRCNRPWKGESDPTATATFSWYRLLRDGCRFCPHLVSEPWGCGKSSWQSSRSCTTFPLKYYLLSHLNIQCIALYYLSGSLNNWSFENGLDKHRAGGVQEGF